MDAIAFSSEESEHLARILLASTRVSQRHHFFSWVHGPLQSLIPHEILLCGVADESGQLQHEVFTACRYFRDEHFERVCHPAQGLLPQLAQEWQESCRPRLIAPVSDDTMTGWSVRLTELELKNIAYHGMVWINGQLKGYASFSRVSIAFDARLELYLEILLPHVLSTLVRVLVNENRHSIQQSRPSILTARESEVLRWVSEGKTNDEIAVILNLSMLTVKNHLRHAMQKLHVRTRGQAVTRALSLGLLKKQDSVLAPITYSTPGHPEMAKSRA